MFIARLNTRDISFVMCHHSILFVPSVSSCLPFLRAFILFCFLLYSKFLPFLEPVCENYFEGGNWALVRRVKQGFNWHPATDNLAGTSVYGGFPFDPASDTFSIKFDNLVSQTTNILFRSGILVENCVNLF